MLKMLGWMTSHVGLLERYRTNGSNVELMISTHVSGGKNLALCLNCNLLSKRKEKSSFFLQAALRLLATRQRGKKSGGARGVSIAWGERLIR